MSSVPSGPVDTGSATPGPLLKLRLSDLRQLFSSLDPAPFHQRDIDSEAAAYIFEWASEAPPRQPLALALVLDAANVDPDEVAAVPLAVHDYFRRRASARRKEVRKLLRTGRISLWVAIAFILVASAAAQWLATVMPTGRYATIVSESIIVACWVAMWRPAGIFLYDWWPLVADARLYDRLSRAGVSVHAAPAVAQGGA
jgi:hypothetical protein